MNINFSKVPSPCYVLDEELLIKNLDKIKEVENKAGVEILISLKAFSSWRFFPLIREYFSTASASGEHEARLAHEELGKRAHTFSPAFSEAEFPSILQFSSHISFNSLGQFNKFYPVIKKMDIPVSPGLRVNPEYSPVGVDLYNPAKPGNRLGISSEGLQDKLPQGVEGLHFHSLCESTSFDLEKTINAFEKKFSHLIPNIKWINMGGGHLITRQDYDSLHLISLLKSFKQKYGVKVILEPGSAFSWETGYLVSTILDIVDRKGIKTAILDVSFTAHMPDCLEMPYKPNIIDGEEPHEKKPVYRMGGISCLAGDYMGNWSFNKELQPGDKIIFKDMMHYTIVKTTMFNGVKHPSLGIWRNNAFHLLKEFTYEDYKNRMD